MRRVCARACVCACVRVCVCVCVASTRLQRRCVNQRQHSVECHYVIKRLAFHFILFHGYHILVLRPFQAI
jgi:hypothetical protein